MILLVFLVLLGSAGVRWTSSRYAKKVDDEHQKLKVEHEKMRGSADSIAREKESYEALGAQADEIENWIIWEEDSTNLLRWFADTATETRVRLANSQMVPERRGRAAEAVTAFKRMRFDLLLEGSYDPLVQYVDRIEHAPYPMLVERLTMNADRGTVGMGNLKLTVSCLYPIEPESKDNQKDGETP